MQLDSKGISRGILILVGLLVGILMAVSITTNPSGGLAAMIPMITVSLSILAFIKPKSGLFALVPLVIWVDEFKRLAIYYGGANSMTVMQTLAMPFVVLGALNLGFILHALFGKIKMDGLCFVFYTFAAIVGGGVFFTMHGSSLPERAQRAANLAGYITLIPIAYTYLKSFDEWRRFFSLQVIFAIPAAAWAIKQYYYGFDQIEWEYARSGLSRVHSGQMLLFENPRTFGFLGSSSALGCVAIYSTYALWHTLRYQKHRVLWIAGSLILVWVLYVSTQRTILVYPLIVAAAAWLFRTRLRVFFAYTAVTSTFVVGVLSSDYMLNDGLERINSVIQSDSSWGSRVLSVNTFSDRLRGWTRLKRPESWTLTGSGQLRQSGALGTDQVAGTDDDNHDVINKVLINYGVFGLLGILIPGFFVVRVLHQSVFKAEDKETRNDAAFVLALALPAIGMALMGGDNFNTNPINMQTWTCFAGVLVSRGYILRKHQIEIARQPLVNDGPIMPVRNLSMPSRQS